eukprot:symbB.v1.2.041448.t1/scaffold8194.1/size7355/1
MEMLKEQSARLQALIQPDMERDVHGLPLPVCPECEKRSVMHLALGLTISNGFHEEEEEEEPEFIEVQFPKHKLEKIFFGGGSQTFSPDEWMHIQSEFSKHVDGFRLIWEEDFTECIVRIVSEGLRKCQSDKPFVEHPRQVGECMRCAKLEHSNYQRSLMIKNGCMQVVGYATISIDKSRLAKSHLEELYFENHTVPNEEEMQSSVNSRSKFRFIDVDWLYILEKWIEIKDVWQYHVFQDFDELRHGLMDTLWCAIGIPVQVIHYQGFPGFDIYDIRIKNTPLSEVSLDDIRESVWDEIGDELTRYGWRVEEIHFRRYMSRRFPFAHYNQEGFIDEDDSEFLQAILLDDPVIEMILVRRDSESEEESEEESEVVHIMCNGQRVQTFDVEDIDHFTAYDLLRFSFQLAQAQDMIAPNADLQDFILSFNDRELNINLMMRIFVQGRFDDTDVLEIDLVYLPFFQIHVKMVNEINTNNIQVNARVKIETVKERVADIYRIPFGDIRLLFRDRDLDEDSTIGDVGITEGITILVMPRARAGGGKRKLEDRQTEVWNRAVSAMDSVNPDNAFLPVLQDLHQKVCNDANIFEDCINQLPPDLLDKLSEAWFNSQQSNVERVIDDIWHVLTPEYQQIFKMEEHCKQARRMIAPLLSFMYLKKFPNSSRQNCEHETFENLIVNRQDNVQREHEINRRVEERVRQVEQQTALDVDDPDL